MWGVLGDSDTRIGRRPSCACAGAQLGVVTRGAWRPGLSGLAAVVVALVLVQALTVGAAGRVISFRGDGGRTIDGLLVEASQHPGPAVVLMSMLGRPKDAMK